VPLVSLSGGKVTLPLLYGPVVNNVHIGVGIVTSHDVLEYFNGISVRFWVA
jgi:hypothetical protein